MTEAASDRDLVQGRHNLQACQMSIFDDIRIRGPSYVLTEEALSAEALREVESGTRPDALWATAMADCHMDQRRATARYIKLRVKPLKEEAMLLLVQQKRASVQVQQQHELQLQEKRRKQQAKQDALEQSISLHRRPAAFWVVIGAIALVSLAIFMFFISR